jgi:hypothetical protein
VKKGRHRRYEEARSLKRTSDDFDRQFEDDEEPCLECGALPGQDHKIWCALEEVEASAELDRGESVESNESDGLFPS